MNHIFSIAAFFATSVMRIARVRWARNGLAAVGLMAALSSPALAVNYVTAFGGGTITLPAQPNAGAIVGRNYITVAQICNALYNQSNCTLPVMNYAQLYAYGGSSVNLVPGPDVPTTVNGLTTRTIINGQAVTGGSTSYTITTPIEVQLVATGQTIANGNVLSNNAAQSPAYFVFSFGPQQLKFQIYLSATIVAIPGTCTVPSQTITLPGVSPTKFGGVGSVQGTQSFSISFKGCPAGFNRVGYSLVPVGSETTVPGALPLSDGSTATGVRIRVADSSGNPATFNTSIPLSTYNKNIASGNYDVQYQASYVQTGSSITPGSVSGSMQVLVDYQ